MDGTSTQSTVDTQPTAQVASQENAGEAPQVTPPAQEAAAAEPIPAPQVVAPEPEVEPEVAEPAQKPDKKTISMPTEAVAAIKREAARKAEARMLKRLGVGSIEDLEELQAGKSSRTRRSRGKQRKPASRPERKPATQTPEEDKTMSGEAATKPNNTISAREHTRIRNERDRLIEDAKRINKSRAAEERKRRAAERQVVALQAEFELKTSAIQAGVKDVDYAIHLLRSQLKGKSQEELEAFNESEFFAKELRKSHPYLYGVTTQPADTSTETSEADKGGASGEGAPPPAAAGGKAPAGADAPIDPTKMTNEQFAKTLAKHGLQDPSHGMPA